MEQDPQPAGTKPQGGGFQSRTDNRRNDQRPLGQGGRDDAQGAADQLYDKAKDATHYVADRASELWDDAYDQGRRYYREGSRAVGDFNGSKVTAALIAAALGYGLAYLIHSHSSSNRVPDYGRTRAEFRDDRGRAYR